MRLQNPTASLSPVRSTPYALLNPGAPVLYEVAAVQLSGRKRTPGVEAGFRAFGVPPPPPPPPQSSPSLE